MKTGAKLTAWNWYIMQKPVLIIAAVLSVCEMALLAIAATRENLMGMPYDALFMQSFAWLVFVGGYLAVLAVSLRPILQAQGKHKGAYTLQTLPVKRGTLLFANIAATALAQLALAAWQVVLTALLYLPTMAIANAATAYTLPQFAIPHSDFVLALLRNALLRILLPTNFTGVCVWLLLLAAPAVLVVCTFYHRGAARVFAFCMGIIGAGGCGYLCAAHLLYIRTNGYRYAEFSLFPAICLLLFLMAAAIAWALHSIRRAAWL